jgi:hypothetical protein
MTATTATVQSDALNEIVLFTTDELTKFSLVQAGLHPGTIYTRRELEHLLTAKATAETLPLIHHLKQMFEGTIKDPKGDQ